MAKNVSVLIRLRPNVAQTQNTPQGMKRRFRQALAERDGVTNLSFPAPSPLPWQSIDKGEDPDDGGERPLENGVIKDGPAVDIRFDWTDEGTDAFLHSTEWFDVSGPLTRAPTVIVIPGGA